MSLSVLTASLPNPDSVLENIKMITLAGFLCGLVIYIVGYFVFLKLQKKSREIGEQEAEAGEKLESLPGRKGRSKQ